MCPTNFIKIGCAFAAWVGDGYCDDITNNLICNYDGGDCCLSNITTHYCRECICIERSTGDTSISSADPFLSE